MKKTFSAALITIATALGLAFAQAPHASAQSLRGHEVPPRTQIAVMHLNGHLETSPRAHESWPAQSLSKLLLGYWVLRHGAPGDKTKVEPMIRLSHDGIANELDARYPQAIPEVIHQFGLGNTHYSGYWGSTRSSAVDIARFVNAIQFRPESLPLLQGMVFPAPIATDGYPQNFGTSTLPGVQASKWGWSNNRDAHASVSIRFGQVVAALTHGDAATHTHDVQQATSLLPIPAELPTSSLPELPQSSIPDIAELLPR